MTALSPEKLAEIKARRNAVETWVPGPFYYVDPIPRLVREDVPALLTEIQRLQEQVEIVRRVGAEETRKAAYEAMDAERRSWESRRAVENVTLAELRAEIERLRDRLTAIGGLHRKHVCDGLPEDCGCADDRIEAITDGSETGDLCGHCRWAWPCTTSVHVRAALHADQPGGSK